MRKSIQPVLAAVAAAATLVGCAGAATLANNDMAKEVTFNCAAGKSIRATFYLGRDRQVDLRLSDGRNLLVPRAISASGTRYATTGERFVFWDKGNTAFITEGSPDRETYSGCVAE